MKHRERQGLWIVRSDDPGKPVMSRGRYKKGNEKGVWKYYYSTGIVSRKEIYRFKKIKTVFYFEDGKIEKKGYAKMDDTSTFIKYYWYGHWKIYDRDGKPEKIIYYEKGQVVKEEKVMPRN